MDIGEHESELGAWRTAQRAAAPPLRAYVHGYFASSSRLRGVVRERHVAGTEVALLLNFGAAHRRLDAACSDEWTSKDGAWIVGLHDRHQLTEAAGERRFMVVRFTPLGAHLFLRMPMHLIANEALDLELIDRALARAVMSRIAAATTWAGRFAAMESLIAERVDEGAPFGAIDAAWRTLVAADGRVALSSLAAEMECSHRTLIAKFRSHFGFPPKTMARLLRFNRAIRALDEQSRTRTNEPASKPYVEADGAEDRRIDPIGWADLAADCGYFDQAHLIKDFRAFAGATPAAFLRSVARAD